jgi:hypothetical protein
MIRINQLRGFGLCTGIAAIAILSACRGPAHPPDIANAWRQTTLGLCEDYPEETRSLDAARRDLELARESGARVLRVAFGWDAIEAERGRCDWSFWDDFVRLAVDDYGLTLIPYVCYTPRWAASDTGDNFWRSAPRDARDFEAFMRVIATRYRGKIHHWELWNEADNPAYWLGTTAQFAELVRAGSRGVRAAAPEAKVVLGGIAGKTEFLEELFAQQGIAPAVDIVNCHAYYETWHPDPIETLTDYLARCREILREHGEREPLWLAEVGYRSVARAKVSDVYHARFRDEHTVEAQAQALRRTLVLSLASGDLPVVAWYRINDLPATEEVIGDDNNRHLGVRDADGAPKPALRAFEELAALFAQPYRPLTAVIRARGTSADTVCAQAFALRDGRTVIFAWLAHPGSAAAGAEPRDDDRDAVAAIDLPGGRSVVFDLRGSKVEQRIVP